jgi:hypothetical protein
MGLAPISRDLPLAASRYVFQRTQPEALRGRQSPVFMRVRRTAPMFTFNLPERFVNDKSPISTDICWFFPKLFRLKPIFVGNPAFGAQKRGFRADVEWSLVAASSW